MLLVYIGSVNI